MYLQNVCIKYYNYYDGTYVLQQIYSIFLYFVQLINYGKDYESKSCQLESCSQPTMIANNDMHHNGSLNKPESSCDENLEGPKTNCGQDQECLSLDLKYIIIDMAPVTFIDSSGSKMLERVSIIISIRHNH